MAPASTGTCSAFSIGGFFSGTRCGNAAPGAAARPPGRAGRRGSGAASARRCSALSSATQAHALVVRHVGGQHDAAGRGPSAAGRRCSRSPRRSRSARPCLRRAGARDCASTASGASGAARMLAYGAIDQIVGQPALEAEAGHAEGAVLIVAVEILRVVRRLGDAPRHAAPARRTGSAARRPRGRSRRAACPDRRASPAAASGTRTSTRSTTAARATARSASATARA